MIQFLIGLLAAVLWLVFVVLLGFTIKANPQHPFRSIRKFRELRAVLKSQRATRRDDVSGPDLDALIALGPGDNHRDRLAPGDTDGHRGAEAAPEPGGDAELAQVQSLINSATSLNPGARPGSRNKTGTPPNAAEFAPPAPGSSNGPVPNGKGAPSNGRAASGGVRGTKSTGATKQPGRAARQPAGAAQGARKVPAPPASKAAARSGGGAKKPSSSQGSSRKAGSKTRGIVVVDSEGRLRL